MGDGGIWDMGGIWVMGGIWDMGYGRERDRDRDTDRPCYVCCHNLHEHVLLRSGGRSADYWYDIDLLIIGMT
jgi:hypothetical protein